MKTIYLLILVMLLSIISVSAQKNVFPLPSGKVGIGTDSPTVLLDVRGEFKLGVIGNMGGSAYSIALTRPNAQLFGGTAAGLQLGGDGDGVDMNITPAGNVGIGTSNAAARLHIVNGLQQIMLGTGENTSGYVLSVGVNDDGVNFYNNSLQRGFNFSNRSMQLLSISSSGNVGIGAPAGNMRLEINGIARSTGMVTFLGPGTASDMNNTAKRGLYVDNGNNTGWELFTLQNASGVAMKVTGNGNVGVGTLNPKGYKLAVEGTIAGRKVRVSQESWADFVFHPDFKLPSLQETEAFIQQHEHLPGIPAEKDIKAEGVDLGEMNKLLLQKIEEQMLYIIQLNKQVQQLSKKVQKLAQ